MTKRILAALFGLAFLGGVGAVLFAWSGLYNVAATAGHWPVTTWFLHFALRNSVETHASGPVPPLDDLALVERGAGHYETGCAPCHGAPGEPANRIPKNMLPVPPYLPAVVHEWKPEELFWIVKHGFKYTGMPAWPAKERDDEVWAMTAFLLKLPELSAEDYAALAAGAGISVPEAGEGDAQVPEAPGHLFTMAEAALVGACVRCHGLDGAGRPSGAFPRLDIQTQVYLERALHEYASGIRPSGIMQPVAAALDPETIARLARHYAEAAAPPTPPPVDPGRLALGRKIATEGMPTRRVAACASCHGLEEGPPNPLFPALNGQYADFIAQQLRLWQADRRGGGPYAEVMDKALGAITPEEIEAVSLFYASLPGSGPAQSAEAGPPAPAALR